MKVKAMNNKISRWTIGNEKEAKLIENDLIRQNIPVNLKHILSNRSNFWSLEVPAIWHKDLVSALHLHGLLK